ncbi:MAG: HK97 family phage prohead protease, partial [Sphingomonadales bacterium]
NGLSFGYRVREARRGRVREIRALDLVEVSLVANPMQKLARIHAVACAGASEGATQAA